MPRVMVGELYVQLDPGQPPKPKKIKTPRRRETCLNIGGTTRTTDMRQMIAGNSRKICRKSLREVIFVGFLFTQIFIYFLKKQIRNSNTNFLHLV